MCPLADEAKYEAVDCRRDSTFRYADRADRQKGRRVKSENCLYIAQGSCLHEYLSPARRLLCRLEEQAYASFQLHLALFEQKRRTENGCCMKIMPAGVHASLILRAVRQIRLLFDGQGVDIGTQGNDRLTLSHFRNKSCRKRQFKNAYARTFQGCANSLRRFHFFIGKLWMAVKPLKFFLDIYFDVFDS